MRRPADPDPVKRPRPAGRRAAAAALPEPADWLVRYRVPLMAAGLAILVMVVFGQVIDHQFVPWDDEGSIAHNPDYTPAALGNLPHYWADWRTGFRQFYAPVLYTTWGVAAWLTEAFDPSLGTLWPMKAWPFHTLSLAAHLAATACVFGVLRRLLRKDGVAHDGPAWVGAAAFAVHPVQVEAVAWASTLYTPLSAALALGALWQFLRFADGIDPESEASVRPRRPWLAYGVGTALYALALLTKPSVVLLPAVAGVILILVCRRRGRPLFVALIALVPWLALAGVATAITVGLVQTASNIFRPDLPHRLGIAGDTLCFYLRSLVLPVNLIVDYGRKPQWAIENAAIWAWLGVAVAITIVAATTLRRAPTAAAAWVAYVAGMAATLGLVPFDYQYHSTTADRYQYLSMFGAALGVAALLAWLTSQRIAVADGSPTTTDRKTAARSTGPRRQPPLVRPAVAYGVAFVVLAAWAGLAGRQAWLWGDATRLFSHTLAVNPDSGVANRAMATLIDWDIKKPLVSRATEALPYAVRATELHPDDVRVWEYLGRLQMERGQWDDAATAYRQAIRVYESGGLGSADAEVDPFTPLGISLARGGKLAEAETVLLDAIRRKPASLNPRRSLGQVYIDQRRFEMALSVYEAALALNPDSAIVRQDVENAKGLISGRLALPPKR